MEPKDLFIPSRALREIIQSDTERPAYHFVCPEDRGYPADPNAAFFANGRVHLMFLYRPEGIGHAFGHLSSADLLHWHRHPDALLPDPNERSVYSGGAFVDADGTAYIAYWSIEDKPTMKEGKNGIRIAYSNDVENDYNVWVKDPENTVRADGNGFFYLTCPDGSVRCVACADPSNIWKKGDFFYFEAGNLPVLDYFGRNTGDKDYSGDFTELYRSTDLHRFEYVHRFYECPESIAWNDGSEDDMCPVFLPLAASEDGGPASGKYLQLFISHNHGCQYYIGAYDEENDRFLPEKHGRMSWKDNAFFAPEALSLPDGRVVMWAWLYDDRKDESARFGWSGIYGLPRTLWLRPDGTLGISPLRELEKLRVGKIAEDAPRSECCEIRVTYRHGENVSLRVLESDDGSEYVSISCDAERGELTLDTSHCGTEGRRIAETAPLVLADGEDLNLTVYVDRSVVEVFANGRQAITRRAVREKRGRNIRFLSGERVAGTTEIFEIDPTNPY